MLSELKAGSDYESLLRQEFKKVSQKEVIPKQQEEMFNIEDNLRLQQNLTKGNLNTIITGAPALVNSIIQEIINTDGDLIQFNKYFSTFKQALGPIKIRSLDDFNKLWTQFKTQQLGQQLIPTPEVIISQSVSNIADLEKMDTKDIDTLFRDAFKRKNNKEVSDSEKIQYALANGSLSTALKIINADAIIQFDPAPKDSSVKTLQGRINNAKLRYIYNVFNPNIKLSEVAKIKWQAPPPVTKEAETLATLPPPIPKRSRSVGPTKGSGLGLNSLDSHFALKKKRLVPTRYR